jgi:hypothetical protein
LLLDPATDPERLLRTFRFALGISSRKRILSRFQKVLTRESGDDALEAWNIPFFYLGGAGTHYPRRDQQGNPVYPPNMRPVSEVLGPWPSQLSEVPHGERSLERLLVAIGFDGEWFDSHDVEGFLRERGIFLEGHSSFLELPETRLAFGSWDDNPFHQETHDTMATVHVAQKRSSPNELDDVLDLERTALSDMTNVADVESSIQLSYVAASAGLGTRGVQDILSSNPGLSHGSTYHHIPISKRYSLTLDVGRFVDRKCLYCPIPCANKILSADFV